MTLPCLGSTVGLTLLAGVEVKPVEGCEHERSVPTPHLSDSGVGRRQTTDPSTPLDLWQVRDLVLISYD